MINASNKVEFCVGSNRPDFALDCALKISRRHFLSAAGALACINAVAKVKDDGSFLADLPGHIHANRGFGASTNHPIATEAARSIQRQGGGVLDMYLAALATAWVVDPANCSPFGRMQGLYLIKGEYGCLHAATKIREDVDSTVPVPGNISAYFDLSRSGRLQLPLKAILSPAQTIARQGFRPTEALRVAILSSASEMQAELREIYLDDNGHVRSSIQNPHLGELLEVLSQAPGEEVFWSELYGRRPGPWERGVLVTNQPRTSRPKELALCGADGRAYLVRATGNLETWGTWTLLGASVIAKLQTSGALSTPEGAMEAYLLSTILVLDRIPLMVGSLRPKMPNPSVEINLESESRSIASRVSKLLASPSSDLWADLARTYFQGESSKTDDRNTNAFAFAENDDFLSFTTSMGPWFGSKRAWFGAGLAYSYAMKSRQFFTGQTLDVTEMSPLIIEQDGRPWLAMGAAGSERIFGALTFLLFLKLGLGRPGDMAELMMQPRLFPKDGKVRIHRDMPESVQRHLIGRGFILDPTEYDARKHLGIVNLVEQVGPGIYRSGADPSADGGAI